ncbi:MAG: hypothetical protein JNK14_15715 [Chitinophagaceae bacterium]|nr:hypothetical protein [Chitinophagaceae bacterium]
MPSRLLLLPLLSFISITLSAQDCAVDKEALKGTYSGDCKKGKANGTGKAVGTDTYEGEFKSGLPDGKGIYTWSNGNTHSGKFVKGLREGKGIAVFKRASAPDSTVEGYWKNDLYAGKYEKPYKIYFTSKSITETEVEFRKDTHNQVTFFITNTSGGGMDLKGEETPRMDVSEVQMVTGAYARIFKNSNHAKKTETIIYDLTCPARMKVIIESEQIEIEFLEAGIYTVNIRING